MYSVYNAFDGDFHLLLVIQLTLLLLVSGLGHSIDLICGGHSIALFYLNHSIDSSSRGHSIVSYLWDRNFSLKTMTVTTRSMAKIFFQLLLLLHHQILIIHLSCPRLAKFIPVLYHWEMVFLLLN